MCREGEGERERGREGEMILHVESGNFLAGNACVIKPSELAVASSNLLAELIPRYLDNVCKFHHHYQSLISYFHKYKKTK